jgi:hypothetical protein
MCCASPRSQRLHPPSRSQLALVSGLRVCARLVVIALSVVVARRRAAALLVAGRRATALLIAGRGAARPALVTPPANDHQPPYRLRARRGGDLHRRAARQVHATETAASRLLLPTDRGWTCAASANASGSSSCYPPARRDGMSGWGSRGRKRRARTSTSVTRTPSSFSPSSFFIASRKSFLSAYSIKPYFCNAPEPVFRVRGRADGPS